jgi:hypothetical protein
MSSTRYSHLKMGLRKDSKLKFDDNIVIDPKVPEVFYDLYGDCAPRMFKKHNMENNIKSAYDKNKFLGLVVRNYYEIFRGYVDEEKSMRIAFNSIKYSLDKSLDEDNQKSVKEM